MTLNTQKTLIDHIKRSMEQTALDLIIAVRVGDTIENIKEYARRIGAMGDALQ